MELQAKGWLVAGMAGTLFLSGLGVDVLLGLHLLVRPPAWRQLAARLRQAPLSWVQAGLLALAVLSMALLVQTLYAWAVQAGWLAADTPPSILLTSGLVHLGALLATVACVRAAGLRWNRAFGLDRRGTLRRGVQGLLAYLGIVPPFFATTVLTLIVLWAMDMEIEQQTVVKTLLQPMPAWMRISFYAFAIGLAPIVEELLFRGILLRLCVSTFGVAAGVAVSAAAFAALHAHLPSVAPLFVIACGFSFAYMYSGSIAVPIVMHAVHNAVQLTLFTLVT
ncbi:MAG: CPBP family intramembrane metalloprotease [Kiritimatiellae bacterium]|nr:CPBP family intramembrane metalloprotease [Kiritimatiellia bacterium]